MGNCCGSPSKSSANFSGEGRTLGAAPAETIPSSPPRAAVPTKIAATGGGGGGRGAQSAEAADAARKAALGRLDRASTAPKGKLAENLAQQKKQTRTDTLEQAAREERVARETDANTKNLQHS